MKKSPIFDNTLRYEYTLDEAIDKLKEIFESQPWGYKKSFCEKNNINYNTLNGILHRKKNINVSVNKIMDIFELLGYDCEKKVEVTFLVQRKEY